MAVIIPTTEGSATTPGIVNGCSQVDPAAGCQGIVTALPATSSQVTASGHGQFSGLQVTVNQTTNLINQAVSVSWSGASPTFSDPTSQTFNTTYNGDYLQIFECWSSNGAAPKASQCEFGGESSNASSAYPIQNIGFEYSRILSQPNWDGYAQLAKTPGIYHQTSNSFTGLVEPFDAVDGTVVKQQADYGWDENTFQPQPFWLNPYFSFTTTNEVDFARTYANGTGQQLFQVDNGLTAPGLGCGQSIEPVKGGTAIPKCWLVVVPRSTPAIENPANVTNVDSVVTSPLSPQAWANRITIPLQFNPVGSSCPINANAQQIIGGELASPAVANWQPALCNLPGHTPFSYIQNNDDAARLNLVDPSYGSAGMSVFSNPIDPAKVSAKNPVVYAPLTLSGVVVGFNIERDPNIDQQGDPIAQEVALSGDRLAHLYLTPLLVARLLTESYRDQLQGVGGDSSSKYAWAQSNPNSIFTDPNFLEYNPEFSQMSTIYGIDAGTLLVEEGSSDATEALWKWVLSDPEARAWLNGKPDAGDAGMNVNPYYSTNAAINPAGVAFGSPTPENYPKSDPYTENTGLDVYGPPQAPARPIGVLDWTPYVSNMATGAADAANANDGAKTTFNPVEPPNLAWTANGPQETGNTFVMSVTTSPSAAQYGLQTASLSAAGDDSIDRTVVAPDAQSLLAGEQAMTKTAVPGVLQSNPSTTNGGAYPLTMLTYAATTPNTLNPTSKKNYAAFLRYAAGAGQVNGTQLGQLPNGYVPLPASLKSETLDAAKTILIPVKSGSTHHSTTGSHTHSKGSGTGSSTSTPSGNNGSGSSGSDQGDGSGSGSQPGSGGSGSGKGSSHSHGGLVSGALNALSAVRTEGFIIGAIRWALPFLLLLGIGTALAAGLMSLIRRRKLAGLPSEATDEHELEMSVSDSP
jgi:hypothetical protein